MNKPTPQEIRAARDKSGLTQVKAAEIVHVAPQTWIAWEHNINPMSLPAWELFLIKTGQMKPPKKPRN
jgi:DNA-binding XRE family transcriptional regulator